MRRKTVHLLVLCILLLFSNLASSQTEPLYMLKFNWMKCSNEQDVIDLANVLYKTEWMKTVSAKIITGACTKPSMWIERVTSVTEKRTPTGRTYYCFDLLELVQSPGLLEFKAVPGEHLCIPPYMLTTVDAELSSRTGDFDIIYDEEMWAAASCIEGGRVQLRKESGALFRTAQYLPWKSPKFVFDVPAGQDVSKALREGCKGVDVQ
jgi:hypothetical protein